METVRCSFARDWGATAVLSGCRLLPSAALKPSPFSATTFPSQDPILEQRKHEDRRVHKWRRVLVPRQPGADIRNYWVVNSRREGNFVSRIFKGVPDRWRIAAWWF